MPYTAANLTRVKIRLLFLPSLSLITACSLVTVPLKIAGKAATTTIGLAGKAAGAGIDAMTKDDDDKETREKNNEENDE